MEQKLFVAKLWSGDVRDQKILVKFSDYNKSYAGKSYVGFDFEVGGKKIVLYFSYNSLYKMYKETLLNSVVKKMN